MNEDIPEGPRPQPLPESDLAARAVPPEQIILVGRPGEHGPDRVRSRVSVSQFRKRRALILFLLTCLSTFLVGFYGEPVFPHLAYVKALWDPQFGSLWE